MSDTFLSPEEVKELTGRSRKSLQIEQLKVMNIVFYVNAAAIPKVPREAMLGKKRVVVKNYTWESRAEP